GKAQNRAMRKRPLPLARLQQVTPIDRGLTGSEVQQRRELYGLNDIVEVPGNPWLELARDTAKDPMIWFFAGTGIVYGLAGQQIEAITLLAAILPLLGMDVFLHRRTRASTQGLRSRLASESIVIRDGSAVHVPAADIVPGDLIVLKPGDILSADGVFIESLGMQIEESVLTGEAYPMQKRRLEAISLGGADPLV